MDKKRWIIFLGLTMSFMVALVVFSKSNTVDISKLDINNVLPAKSDNGNIGDHVYGNPKSPVTVINYTNLQCSGCASSHPAIKAVTELYKDKIKFVSRFMHLPSHTNGKAAQGSAEAAGLQGKFWEMSDILYGSQNEWSMLSGTQRTDYFKNIAKTLDLDTDKFLVDLESSAVSKKMDFDNSLGHKALVNATPTFFINGVMLQLTDIKQFTEAIDAELVKADIEPPK